LGNILSEGDGGGQEEQDPFHRHSLEHAFLIYQGAAQKSSVAWRIPSVRGAGPIVHVKGTRLRIC
jgi:hypothetical protein